MKFLPKERKASLLISGDICVYIYTYAVRINMLHYISIIHKCGTHIHIYIYTCTPPKIINPPLDSSILENTTKEKDIFSQTKFPLLYRVGPRGSRSFLCHNPNWEFFSIWNLGVLVKDECGCFQK